GGDERIALVKFRSLAEGCAAGIQGTLVLGATPLTTLACAPSVPRSNIGSHYISPPRRQVIRALPGQFSTSPNPGAHLPRCSVSDLADLPEFSGTCRVPQEAEIPLPTVGSVRIPQTREDCRGDGPVSVQTIQLRR